jgi:hypothetical protein
MSCAAPVFQDESCTTNTDLLIATQQSSKAREIADNVTQHKKYYQHFYQDFQLPFPTRNSCTLDIFRQAQ